MGKRPATITRLTNELVERRLFEHRHDDADRRYVDGLLPDQWKSLSRQLAQLTAGNQAQFEKLLRKLVAGWDDQLLAIE